ncbi:CHY zinc finger domain-containing protein [Elsinoe australis]|uniref:CHY zinc finger domain-containing protein n=1 Tax=Elsinoe australis TaxID=40998 RepID=A0A4U7BF87_9PEZI|nr:CHY zinc finger domain-containing protein [Elsinoe australis]
MCKHVLNAQVAIRSPCCRKWFDCAECHAETEDHRLKQALDMTFACKKCKKCFRKDMNEFEDSDEYCPHCDNHFVIEALEPQARLEVEGEDVRKDARMLKDDRVKGEERQTIWNLKEASERLG